MRPTGGLRWTDVEAPTRSALDYRLRLERDLGFEDDPHCMVGACRSASHELAEELRADGFPARAEFGTYHGIGEGYPALVASRSGEPFDDDFDDDGSWLHWYVVCGDLIVDVTSDQFHPDEPGAPRVVVTDLGDDRYAATTPSPRCG